MQHSGTRRLIVFAIIILIAGGAIAKPPLVGTPDNPMIVKMATENKPEDFKLLDFITMALGAATVAVASVGVVVAIAAVWGYKEIKEKSIEAATKAAKEKAEVIAEKVAQDKATVIAARMIADWLKAYEKENEEEAETSALAENTDDTRTE